MFLIDASSKSRELVFFLPVIVFVMGFWRFRFFFLCFEREWERGGGGSGCFWAIV